MQSLKEQSQTPAEATVSVLITAKWYRKDVLRALFTTNGPGPDKPFVAENCAAIQSTLLESELFGYEAGAFSSAERRKHGIMEVADSGVLFLDEISSMPLDTQAKILRAIEERSFRRVGGTAMIKVDLQVIAASNRDIPLMIKENEFRQDLYYRLKVVDLHVPALRERREDIPEMVGFFIRKYNLQLGMDVRNISALALEALKKYSGRGISVIEPCHRARHSVLRRRYD